MAMPENAERPILRKPWSYEIRTGTEADPMGFDDTLSKQTNYDIPVYLEQAAEIPMNQPVLVLACNPGRLRLHLADKGFPVVGLDLSRLLPGANELRRMPLWSRKAQVEALNKLIQSMRSHTFSMIILTDPAIRLLHTERDWNGLLESVYDLLADGGRFVFDYSVSSKSKVAAVTPLPGVVMESAIRNFYTDIAHNGINRVQAEGDAIFPERTVFRCIADTEFDHKATISLEMEGNQTVKFVVLEKPRRVEAFSPFEEEFPYIPEGWLTPREIHANS